MNPQIQGMPTVAVPKSTSPSRPTDFIPGINVGNIFKQAGSLLGLTPARDYDIFDKLTLSGREGQTQLGSAPSTGSLDLLGIMGDLTRLDGIGAGGTTDTGVGQGGVSAGPSRAQIDPLLAALESLGVARSTADTRAQSDYNKYIKQYDDQFAIDQGRYGQQTTQNEQNLTGNRQAALLQASQGGMGLRAVLAAMGALNGTGSILADRAISQAANKDIGEAQNNFETNASTLSNAWADTEAKDKQRRAQAEAAREAALAGNETNFLNNRIDILGKLANLYGAGSSEGANYASQAAKLYGDVAKIPQGQAAAYTPVSDLYSPQVLSNYLAGTNNLQVQAQSGNSQPSVPGVVATVSKRKDELS